jgi:hypothetical protein
LFFGCQNVQQPEKPENLISKDKMIDILTETYMANAARSINNRAINEKGIKMDSLIYKNFGIDSLQFFRSNAYYASDVNSYMEIVQKVETRLTAMQQKMDSIFEAERARKDSISKKFNADKTGTDTEPIKDSLN